MARAEGFHSRLVAWLKILLPLAALGVLSTIFLFSHTVDPTQAIPFAKVDVKKLAQEPRITAPDYAGVTADGTAVVVTATEARPGTPAKADGAGEDGNAATGASASGLMVRLETPGGSHTYITAAEGSLDPANSRLRLAGGVTIRTSAGYTVTAAGLTGTLDRSDLHSTGGPVHAVGPPGRLTAGAMQLARAPGAKGEPAEYVLVFNGGVKLIYNPGDREQ